MAGPATRRYSIMRLGIAAQTALALLTGCSEAPEQDVELPPTLLSEAEKARLMEPQTHSFSEEAAMPDLIL